MPISISIQRRQFLLSSLPALALSQTAPKGGRPRICVVAGKESRRPDICAVAEDLGLTCDLTGHLAAEQADPQTHSILWITCPDYPTTWSFHLPCRYRLRETRDAAA